MSVDAVDRFLLNLSGLERFGVGASLILVGSSVGQANLGAATRLGGLRWLLGFVLLAMSLEPTITRFLGGRDWNDLSTGNQLCLLFVLSVVGLLLGLVVTVGTGLVVDAL